MKNWKPTLGGWLAMLNCVGWLILVIASMTGEHYPFLGIGLLILALPVAWFFVIPPIDYRLSEIEVFLACCLIGLNSLLWGYGLASILKWRFGRRDARI